jgi:hypothetical protein
MELPGDAPWEPNKTQQASFMKHYDAVNDPLSVLDHVKNGTLSNEHMEALQAVHPGLLQNLQDQVSQQMSPSNMKSLSYSKKVALSKFLGSPVDSSLTPQSVMANQANYAPKNAAQAMQKGQKSTQEGMSKLNLGSRSTTEIETDESDAD